MRRSRLAANLGATTAIPGGTALLYRALLAGPASEYGNWNSVWKRFWRLSRSGVFEAFFQLLAERSETAHLVQFFDSTTVRAHVSAAGGKGGSRSRRSAAREAVSRPRSTSRPISTVCPSLLPWRRDLPARLLARPHGDRTFEAILARLRSAAAAGNPRPFVCAPAVASIVAVFRLDRAIELEAEPGFHSPWRADERRVHQS